MRQGVRAAFGSRASGIAAGLRIRHDHASQFVTDNDQRELALLGIDSSPALVRAPEGNGCAGRFICLLSLLVFAGRSLNLMADNGCQPTAVAFMRACAALGIRQAFTSYNNPKGNADTERFLRTLKEELVWFHEWTSPATFFDALERWIAGYNQGYLHSALGYRSPAAFEAEHLSHATLLPTAC